MIYFGWPVAHENDAERCVRSALEIVAAARNVLTIEPLAAHVGIATGDVVVGGAPGAGGGRAGLAYGEAPNLAARLQAVATAHEVLIAHSTRTLLGDTFELTDAGTLPLRNLRPSRIWRVEAVRSGAGRFDTAHAGAALTDVVGRTDEVALLLRKWRMAQGGRGGAVLISGDAGIGKSRLSEVLRERIAGDAHATLRYQCSPFHLNAPLYPLITHFEFAAGFTREDTSEQKLDKLEKLVVGDDAQQEEFAALLAALLSLPTKDAQRIARSI
jgi:hypothetical protein